MDGEDVGGCVRGVGGGAVFVCIFVGTLMLSAALDEGDDEGDDICRRAGGRASEAVHYIGHAERDKRHCAVVPSSSRSLPLDTFLRADLTRSGDD